MKMPFIEISVMTIMIIFLITLISDGPYISYQSYPGLGCAENDCSPDAICEAVGDSRRCSCKPGYEGDGFTCLSKFNFYLHPNSFLVKCLFVWHSSLKNVMCISDKSYNLQDFMLYLLIAQLLLYIPAKFIFLDFKGIWNM